MLNAEIINSKIGRLSEGQKGLVAFARLVLQKTGAFDFGRADQPHQLRHLPIIAEALNKYDGAMILVSHVPDFVRQIRIDEVLDLEK